MTQTISKFLYLSTAHQSSLITEQQQEAFQTLKQKLTSAEVMCYYNPIAEINIIVDARPKGLGAILSQKQKNRQFRHATVYTDHKPLERLLATSPTPPRIQRWLMCLQAYKYTIRY